MRLIAYISLFILFTGCGLDSEFESEENSNSLEEKYDSNILSIIDSAGIVCNWNIGDCDNSIDAYKAIDRISHLELINDTLNITISFKDNCCARFHPFVQYKDNTLYLEPYKTFMGDECHCNCCYSMELKLVGIISKDFKTIFRDNEISYSQDPYPLKPIKFIIDKGDTINLNNKYGTKIGLWKNIDSNNNCVSEYFFDIQNNSLDSKKIWIKQYSENDELIYWKRNDTTEQWFDNGVLKAISTRHFEGNDELEHRKKFYPNGNLEAIEITRYNELFSLQEREELYFNNGQIQHLKTLDSIYQWNEKGQLLNAEPYDNGILK